MIEIQGENQQLIVVKIIQQLFDDVFLYQNKQIRTLVESNHKGYVDKQDIIQHPYFVKNCDAFGCQNFPPQFIEEGIQKLSKKLIMNNGKIRRIDPFVNQIKERKILPIYIDHLPQNMSENQLWHTLSFYTTLYKIDYFPRYCQAFVYCDNPTPLFDEKNKQNLFGGQALILEYLQVEEAYQSLNEMVWKREVNIYKKKLNYKETGIEVQQIEGNNEDDERFEAERKRKEQIGRMKKKQKEIEKFNNQELLSL